MTTTFDTAVRTPPAISRLKRLSSKPALIAGGALVLALAGALWILMPASSVSTDDAYSKADSTVVAPKVQGLIARILVRDNQHVRAGQPLIQIDPEDYAQAVDAAKADVAAARAALTEQAAQVGLAQANVNAASASIRSADAASVRASADRTRYEALVKGGDVSRSQADQARATAVSASADADKSRAALAASQQQRVAVERSGDQLRAALQKAQATLAQAELNLSHTIVRSPVNGVVGDRQAQTGEYVQPGTQMMTIVPLQTIYVTANFKETQTARMLVGQPVQVSFDALPTDTFNGEVESFAPGSGSEFSLLPYEPATGNFTRIVQRLPVRIKIYPGQKDANRLRPGLSADVTVQFNSSK
ncbi:MAG TPA: HlyD family secretion protein [Rhizomicrobium sp.]|jgi:membrane fusion protein (multidrug efflux system)|nr:HlyD family secretion protein [Rhizomicrobium sp.]